MTSKELLSQMTLEEKALIITGAATMETNGIERLGIKPKSMADGPHGVRRDPEWNCTHFPNLCLLGATWDKKMAYKMGEALGDDCAHHGIGLLLGPGINIKRNANCGRNFEYLSEDPVLAGEIGAGYVNGLQSKNVGATVKHYCANNQERMRLIQSSEVDERTLREIYTKAFEIVVKKAKPKSIMCSYNKVNSIWASENKYLLRDILKDSIGFEGFVVSDWGAVQDPVKCIKAGLDLHMPNNPNLPEIVKKAMDSGKITMDELDGAVLRVLDFMLSPDPVDKDYDRVKQHKIAGEIASSGTVLLKNDDNVLPLTEKKYKTVAVIGEFAVNPLICGQGSAEVLQAKEFTDSPLDELKKRLPSVNFIYKEYFKRSAFSETMLWPLLDDYYEFLSQADACIIFAGSMASDDTENFDRRDLQINPNYELFIENAYRGCKNVILVLQNGGAIQINDKCNTNSKAIVEMWLGGEAAGSGIADVLCGIVNPSGKLPETFPTEMRTDLDYPGDTFKVEYREKLDVGYRYYDKHPEKIRYPFGHGLSYTTFDYSNIKAEIEKENVIVEFDLKNTGDVDGAEVYQVYDRDVESTASKPIKELVYFDKVMLKAGETKHIKASFPVSDMSYFNVMLHEWVCEKGEYEILVGASSRDIRLKTGIFYDAEMPYTMKNSSEASLG